MKDSTGQTKPEQVKFQIADDEEDEAAEASASLIKKPEIVIEPPAYSQAVSKL